MKKEIVDDIVSMKRNLLNFFERVFALCSKEIRRIFKFLKRFYSFILLCLFCIVLTSFLFNTSRYVSNKGGVFLARFLEILSIIPLFYLIFMLWKIFFSSQQSLGLNLNEGSKSIKFNSIGGLNEIKEEFCEVIDYFENPQLFIQRGAKIPKGILLFGPPGNGKTLLARALANECEVPFIFRSGAELEELVVGYGSLKIRSMFEEARSYPNGSIIFIDEIDAFASKRYSARPSHGEQTLNQLLSEMDGFLSSRDNVFIIAATNRIDVLDNALLRPGRFDRKIYIPNPNFESRKEIIEINLKGKNFGVSVDIDEVASITKGLSGSEISSLINEALIISIRNNRNVIDRGDIFEALDRILIGPLSKGKKKNSQSKIIAAYHEAGHAVVALTLPETTVKKMTIVSRLGSNIGGYTWVDFCGNSEDDSYFLNKAQIISKVMSLLGGRISEELVFGFNGITTGAHSDIRTLNDLLNDLVLNYGMSELGILSNNYINSDKVDYNFVSNNFSDNYMQNIEREKERIIKECQKKVKKILKSKLDLLRLFADLLIERETIERDEILYIFVNKILPRLKLLG